MDEIDADRGVEVVHKKYGRGYILEVEPASRDSLATATVYFDTLAETTTVPLISLSKAKDSLSIDVRDGDSGFAVDIDDGMFTLFLEPDGSGTGYDVKLAAGKAHLDECHLSAEELR